MEPAQRDGSLLRREAGGQTPRRSSLPAVRLLGRSRITAQQPSALATGRRFVPLLGPFCARQYLSESSQFVYCS
jgi:hypothetical protein